MPTSLTARPPAGRGTTSKTKSANGASTPKAAACRGSVVAHRVDDQLLLDREGGVGVEVGVAGDEDVRGDRPVALGLDPVVDVRRAHRVAAHGAQQLAARAVGGHRVAGRDDAAEPVGAVVVGGEQAAQVAQLLLRVLAVVVAGVVGLPDVDGGARRSACRRCR